MAELETTDVGHDRFVNAITKLDKTQHIREPTRNEPSIHSSEFNLVKRSNKVDINNLVKVLENTTHHVEIGKNLKKVQDSSNVLSKPLEKPQAERLKRSTGYEETKNRVGRWDAVVARSRTVDCVYFPMKRANNKMLPAGEFASKLELKSPLELELEQVDPPPEILDDDEKQADLYPMTYQEMVEQRQNLAKMRAQQSFKAAKAKRQSKIKSKKYHRILKKEKLKQQLKEFEELKESNPEEALKKLEALEKEHALERHTLRHKNTGKWAKSKLVRAKYDREVRQELAEQLSVGRKLTHKTQNDDTSEEEAANETIPDVTLPQDPKNVWMQKHIDASNSDVYNFEYKKHLKENMQLKKDYSDSDSESDNCTDTINNITLLMTENNVDKSNETFSEDNRIEKENEDLSINNSPLLELISINDKINEKKTSSNVIATTKWTVEILNSAESVSVDTRNSEEIANAFEVLETNIAGKVETKLKKLRENIKNLDVYKGEKIESTEEEIDNIQYLQFKNQNKNLLIDHQLIETTSNQSTAVQQSDDMLKHLALQTPIQQNDIDLYRFTKAKPKFLNSALSEANNNLDELDDEQVVPKVNIEDVLEEDDIVASFRHEKEEEINKDIPKDIDLTLPGWGSWGGKGIKAPKRKRNRFILKGAVKMPRRDENKGDIIIKEYKDPKLSAHKITEVPFPFTSVKEFEASIRAPLGNTFIPERAHRKLIKPNVITKSGTIIEAMDEDELLLPKNQSFRNQSIIHLLAKNKKQT